MIKQVSAITVFLLISTIMFAESFQENNRFYSYFRKGIRYDNGLHNISTYVREGETEQDEERTLKDEFTELALRPEFSYYLEKPDFLFVDEFIASYGKGFDDERYRVNSVNKMRLESGETSGIEIRFDSYFQYMSREHENTTGSKKVIEDDITISFDLFLGKMNGKITDHSNYYVTMEIVKSINRIFSKSLTKQDIDKIIIHISNTDKNTYEDILNVLEIRDTSKLTHKNKAELNAILNSISHTRETGKHASLGFFGRFVHSEDEIAEIDGNYMGIRRNTSEELFYGLQINLERYFNLTPAFCFGVYLEGRAGIVNDMTDPEVYINYSDDNDFSFSRQGYIGVTGKYETYRGLAAEILSGFTYFKNEDNHFETIENSINFVYSLNSHFDLYAIGLLNLYLYGGEDIFLNSYQVLDKSIESGVVGGIKLKF